jgi:hypothetical protein
LNSIRHLTWQADKARLRDPGVEESVAASVEAEREEERAVVESVLDPAPAKDLDSEAVDQDQDGR